MLMNGLFALLSKANMVMDKNLLQDLKAYMAILPNMETIGTLCNSLICIWAMVFISYCKFTSAIDSCLINCWNHFYNVMLHQVFSCVN
jgi:hypothetical protein